MKPRAWFVSVLPLFVAAALAACGGGGGSSPSAPPPAPATPTPCPAGFTGTPPNCALAQSGTGTIPLSVSTTAPLPAAGGYGGTITLPLLTVAGSSSLAVTTSVSPPSGAPTLSAHLRRPSSAQHSPLLYITLSRSEDVTFSATPGFTFTVPPGVSGPFYLAEYQDNAWVTVGGPQTTATFPSTSSSYEIAPGQPAYFALYTGGALAPPSGAYAYLINRITSGTGPVTQDSVAAFPASANGPTPPTYQIDVPRARILATATDASGALYVLDNPGQAPEIRVYAPGAGGNATPSRIIAGSATLLAFEQNVPAYGAPTALAVGSDGTIYVAFSTDGANGAHGPCVVEFAPGANGNVAPVRTITASTTSTAGAAGVATSAVSLALDAQDDLFVAMRPAANVGVSAYDQISVYAAGAAGNATPLHSFNVPADPVSIAVDGTHHVYALIQANGTGSVNVYAWDSSSSPGNPYPAPLQQIAGPATMAPHPISVAVDRAGLVYVLDAGVFNGMQQTSAATIGVFPAGAGGNVAPTRSETIPLTIAPSFAAGFSIGTQP